jgi:hypothetical protein
VKIVVCDRHALMRRSHHDNCQSRVDAVPSVLVIVLWTLCLSATRIGLQGVRDVIDNDDFGAG